MEPPPTTAVRDSTGRIITSSKTSAATPFYKNGRVLLSHDFRYFGAKAVVIPHRLHLLSAAAEALGQGHRVYRDSDPESREADLLFRLLWKKQTRYTPRIVNRDAYDH